MKKSLYLAFFLAVVSGLAGVVLASANNITAPIIEANNIQKEAAQFAAIFGEDTIFEEATGAVSGSLEKVYIAGDKGYGYKVNVMGRNGSIVYIVGIDQAGDILGYSVIEQGETPGIGDVIKGDSFISSITSSNIHDTIDSVSGSTISTNAVISGLDEVKSHFDSNFKN